MPTFRHYTGDTPQKMRSNAITARLNLENLIYDFFPPKLYSRGHTNLGRTRDNSSELTRELVCSGVMEADRA